MRNLQPYEKHLADQLRQVTVPDVEKSWEQMRTLLDREQPQGATAWSGNRKWWWMGTTVAIIIAGLWVSQQLSDQREAKLKSELALVEKTSREPADHSDAVATTPGNEASQNSSLIEKSNDQSNPLIQPKETENTTNSTQPFNHKKTAGGNESDKIDPESRISNDIKNGSVEKLNQGGEISRNKTSVVLTSPGINSSQSSISSKGESSNRPSGKGSSESKTRKGTEKSTKLKNEKFATGNGVLVASNESGNTDGIKEARELSGKVPEHEIKSVTELLHSPVESFDDFPVNKQGLKAEPGKTDKAFTREMRQKSLGEDNRKLSKRSMKGNYGDKDHELTFAAGLALPQSFSIGSQQKSEYGVNATTSRISDYLPVPYFQYHVNTKLFVQTEFHFQSPQSTDQLLLSYNSKTTGNTIENKVILEKLYYFHIPLNVYFSPVRNVYLGGGIQYSSLLSGVANYQEVVSSGGNVISSESNIQRFKDDSVAAKLTPSEWRYQFDANYYKSRFTLGLRFNQALNDFVNMQPAIGMPTTQSRNKSFLLYLRYNIWEEKKK